MIDPREAALDADHAVRWYRRGHARPPGQDRFTNWYVGIVGVVTFAAMFFSGILGTVRPTACAAESCHISDPSTAGPALALLAVGAGLWLVGVTGPVGASPQRLTWLLRAPADRGVLLRVRYWVTLAIAAALGALAAAAPVVAGLDLGAGTGAGLARLGPAVLLGAAGGAGSAGLGAILQSAGNRGGRLLARTGLVLATLGALAAAVTSAGWFGGAVADAVGGVVSTPTATVVTVAAAVVAVLALVLAVRGRSLLAGLDAAVLARSGQLAGALGDATLAMDAMPAAVVISSRRAETRGRFRSRPLSGTGARALLRSDARRLSRRPQTLAGAALLMPLPALTGVVIDPRAAVVVLALSAVGWIRGAAAGYLAWAGSTGLRRMTAVPARRAAPALLTLPALALLAWTAAAAALAGLPAWHIVAIVATGVAAVLDAGNAAKPAEVGVMISTPMGAVPVGIVQRVTGGLLLVGLCVVPLLLTTSPLALLAALFVLARQATSDRRPR